MSNNIPSQTSLTNEWKIDADKISDSEIDVALDIIPKLHAKYADLMTKYVREAKLANGEFVKMRKLRFQYYRGDLNADVETLKLHGWVPLQKKIDSSHIKEHLEGDDKLVELKLIAEQYSDLAEFCKEVLSALKTRSFSLQTKVKWKMFLFDGSEG